MPPTTKEPIPKTPQPEEEEDTYSVIIHSQNKKISIWLFICAGLVFAMVILGGITRLTESGLSIVDWKPLVGAIPPLTEAAWELEFEKYKQFPEYKKLNSNMNLQEFKYIFFFEWAHRNLGRFIGVAFALPFMVYHYRGWIVPSLRNRLGFLFALGGLQGAIGWWMVKSGLKEDLDHPRVSAPRLATHLGSAFVIYLGILWTALGLRVPPSSAPATPSCIPPGLKGSVHALAGLTFLTAMSGAFVAGLDAGLMYPEIPYMGNGLVPEEYWELEPAHRNFYENGATAQFNHRLLATVTSISTLALWAASRRVPLPPQVSTAFNHLLVMVFLQATLGITTLLYYVPTPVAASHQAGSLILLSLYVRLMHVMKYARFK